MKIQMRSEKRWSWEWRWRWRSRKRSYGVEEQKGYEDDRNDDQNGDDDTEQELNEIMLRLIFSIQWDFN